MRHIRWMGAILAAAALASTAPALAKGEANYLSVTGPGIIHPAIVRDPDLVVALSMAALESVEEVAFPPAWIESAYIVTRGIEENGQVFPFDQVLYVPDPAGGRDYVYYVGIFNGDGPYDRNWYFASERGQEAMAMILSEAAMAGPAPVATAAAAIRPGTDVANLSAEGAARLVVWPVGLATVILAAAGFAAGWVLARRRASAAPLSQ